jgi:MFS family permease
MPLGLLQDRYSIRKIFLLGLALLTLVPLLYAVANRWDLIVLAVLIYGIGFRLGHCVVICDISLPNKDRATGQAICEGLGALPRLFAPTIAAVIITWFGGISSKGIRPLYWIQFVAQITLFFFVALRLTEVVRSNKLREIKPIDDFRDVFRQGTSITRWLFFQSINVFTGTMMTTFRFPFTYEVKGSSQFVIGGIATAMILTEAVFSTPFGRLADRIGRKKTLYLVTPLFCIANIIFVLAPSPGYLLIAGFFLGFRMIARLAYGSITPELVPMDYIGRWRGLIGLCVGLAAIPAPIIGGLIWTHMGPGWVFIIPTLIDIFIMLPLIYSMPETLRTMNTKNG